MIRARSLVKDFDGFTALDGVDFEFDKPGIFGIIGHNGAGKTTLLKIMSGLIRPTSGELEINGVDVVRHPNLHKRTLGYLPEESRLYENMNVWSYLAFFGEIYGLSDEEIRKKSRELLSKLKLDPGDKKMGEFSKGMKRKAAIARSLMHDPSFLVYDEPTSGLDPMTSRYISEFLREIKEEGEKTIILSAHNLYQVEEICDRVLILRRGKTLALGDMDELRSKFGSVSYEIEFVLDDRDLLEGVIGSYSESAGIISATVEDVDDLSNLTNVVAKGGGRVKKIESHYPSLEDMLVMIGE
jgi:ABC-2 type transport system ATP-binding protein